MPAHTTTIETNSAHPHCCLRLYSLMGIFLTCTFESGIDDTETVIWRGQCGKLQN